MNTTEKYIKKAVDEAKKELSGANVSNCNIEMNMQADGATKILAEALRCQAEANEASSNAMLQLAMTLKPIDVCAIKITNDKIEE
jgi:hypothetical protein